MKNTIVHREQHNGCTILIMQFPIENKNYLGTGKYVCGNKATETMDEMKAYIDGTEPNPDPLLNSQVKNNIEALRSYIDSMNCAIDKAERGSDCEDAYFIEKLEKMANRLGYNIVKK